MEKIKSPQIETPVKKSKRILSVYGQSKFKASKYLIHKFKKLNFPSIILRPYLIYGPNQEPNRFIPYVIKVVLKIKNLNYQSVPNLEIFYISMII